MAVVQTEYGNVKAEPDEITKWREEVRETFSKCGFRCSTCGEIDYEILHPKTTGGSSDVRMICNRCGRKHYFDLPRLTKFLESH